MKFTVVIALLCVASSWAVQVNKSEEPKDKREAQIGYPSLSSHSYAAPSLGHEDASSVSIGAGYSVGGGKPTYSYAGHGGGTQLQFSPESLQSSGHATIQLAPITLQGGHGLQSSDLSQLMSQLSHSLNSGALSLQPSEAYQPAHGANQEVSLAQYTLGAPKIQQYAIAEQQSSVPAYAAGTKGLGSYSTGPVLFSPSDAHGNVPAVNYAAPSSGYSLSGAGGSAHALLNAPSSGHSFGGYSSGSHNSFGEGANPHGGSGYSLSGLSLGNSGLSLGGSGHSFGAAIKGLHSGYAAPSKNSFKPSAFLGSSVQSEGAHGLSSLSGSYGAPSFGAFSGGNHGGLSLASADHGASLGGSLSGFGSGSSKFISPTYLPSKPSGFGSLESLSSFSSDGHLASPPGTTYGVPTASYGLPATATHAASNANPQYYVPMKQVHYQSFGGGSSSYRAPSSGHGSLSSLSSGSKHGFGSYSPSSRYVSAKDTHGAHSETSYNTIKYSEELKPRVH
ncbi:hypothetical protein ACJJTC_009536 [Scirpophaga incertulas]